MVADVLWFYRLRLEILRSRSRICVGLYLLVQVRISRDMGTLLMASADF